MAPPTPTVSRVLVGVAYLYTAPVGTAAPADTVAPGELWPSPWVYIGATEEGVTVAKGADIGTINIEESPLPVKRVTNETTFEMRFALSEDTVESMKLAYGGGVITTISAATGVAGKKRLILSSTLTELAAGFEGVNSNAFPRRVVVPRVNSAADVETAYRRAANNRSYPTTLGAVCLPEDIVIDDWTALPLP